MISSLQCSREVVESLGDGAQWKEGRSLNLYPWRGYWDPKPSSLPFCFLIATRWATSSSMHSKPWDTVLPPAQSNGAKQLWTETSQSVNLNKLFLFWLSQLFSYRDWIQTKTGSAWILHFFCYIKLQSSKY